MSQSHQHADEHDHGGPHVPSEEARAAGEQSTGHGNAAAQDQLRSARASGGSMPAAGMMGLPSLEDMGEALGDAWDWLWGNEEEQEGGGTAPTPDARHTAWWAQYKASDDSTRRRMARAAWDANELQAHMDGLTVPQQVDPDEYRDELGEVLDWLQRFETVKAARATSGDDTTTFGDMAQTQADYMTAEAERRAREAAGGAAPTQEQIEDAHEEIVEEQDYLETTDETEWSQLSPEEQAAWTARGQAAITVFVTFATANYSELEVQASEIELDYEWNEANGAIAYVSGEICYLSRGAVEAIEANPDFATSTIMHELRGHPEFDTGFSLSMWLYDEAASRMPGYTQPAEDSDERDAEWQRFEYFESEIGALMREEAWWVDAANGVDNPMGSPMELLDTLLQNMAQQWAPELRAPLITGLHQRFVADPRVTPHASAMFVTAVSTNLGISL